MTSQRHPCLCVLTDSLTIIRLFVTSRFARSTNDFSLRSDSLYRDASSSRGAASASASRSGTGTGTGTGTGSADYDFSAGSAGSISHSFAPSASSYSRPPRGQSQGGSGKSRGASRRQRRRARDTMSPLSMSLPGVGGPLDTDQQQSVQQQSQQSPQPPKPRVRREPMFLYIQTGYCERTLKDAIREGSRNIDADLAWRRFRQIAEGLVRTRSAAGFMPSFDVPCMAMLTGRILRPYSHDMPK